MTTFKGKGVYGAIALGKISVFKRKEASVKRVHVDDIEAEKARLAAAKEESARQLSEIYEKALKEVGEANAQIFEIHMMMIEDDDYNESIQNIIETQSVNAEYAVAVTADNFAEMFASMDDAYMQARIIRNLAADDVDSGESDEKVIICADDLAPSETVLLDKDKVLAFVTAFGSSNSHTAILARNMNIPAIIGAGEDFLKAIHDGDFAGVDGYTGEILIEPDDETTSRLKKKQKEDEDKKRLWNNKEVWNKLNVASGIDAVGEILKYGEKIKIGEVIEEISGYDDKLDEIIKN